MPTLGGAACVSVPALSTGGFPARRRRPASVLPGRGFPTRLPDWRWLGRMLRANGRASDAAGRAMVSSQAHLADTGPTIDELYHARRLGLVRLAVLMVDDLPTAEDIVQDVFAALYRRHGDNLTGLTDPHAYLTTGVLNAARSALRRRRSARAYRPPRPGTSPPADERVLLAAADRALLDALRELPVRQRQVVVLRYWSDLSEAEIAEMLSVSRGTVKSAASRALATLRRVIGDPR